MGLYCMLDIFKMFVVLHSILVKLNTLQCQEHISIRQAILVQGHDWQKQRRRKCRT